MEASRPVVSGDEGVAIGRGNKMQAFGALLQVDWLRYAAETPQHTDLLQDGEGPRPCRKPARQLLWRRGSFVD